MGVGRLYYGEFKKKKNKSWKNVGEKGKTTKVKMFIKWLKIIRILIWCT
jgi:hypothetical protein